jgi:hypothetical protein
MCVCACMYACHMRSYTCVHVNTCVRLSTHVCMYKDHFSTHTHKQTNKQREHLLFDLESTLFNAGNGDAYMNNTSCSSSCHNSIAFASNHLSSSPSNLLLPRAVFFDSASSSSPHSKGGSLGITCEKGTAILVQFDSTAGLAPHEPISPTTVTLFFAKASERGVSFTAGCSSKVLVFLSASPPARVISREFRLLASLFWFFCSCGRCRAGDTRAASADFCDDACFSPLASCVGSFPCRPCPDRLLLAFVLRFFVSAEREPADLDEQAGESDLENAGSEVSFPLPPGFCVVSHASDFVGLASGEVSEDGETVAGIRLRNLLMLH